MARNNDRDIREEERRKMQLIKAGFELFSENGIENVSLQTVADAADVGVATMYKYYQNKINLVIAISATMWGNYWKYTFEDNKEFLEHCDAYQMIEMYCDKILSIYIDNPNMLKFSNNYKTFVCRENVKQEQFKDQMDALEPMVVIFYKKFEQAKKDKCIRTDISREEMFTTVALTMLGMAERYAQGLVWANNPRQDYKQELIYTKEMILKWIKGQE